MLNEATIKVLRRRIEEIKVSIVQHEDYVEAHTQKLGKCHVEIAAIELAIKALLAMGDAQ